MTNSRTRPLQTARRLTMLARSALVLSGLMLAGAAWAGEAQELGQLDAIYRSALTNNARALTEVQQFAVGVNPATSYAVRVELIKTRLPILLEAGRSQAVRDDIAQLRELGNQHNDAASQALADIWAADRLTDSDRPQEALALLAQTSELAHRSADPFVLMMWNGYLANACGKTGEFDKGLEHALAALRLAEQQPRRRARAKFDRLNQLGSLYVAMKEPGKALAAFQEALQLAREVGSQTALASLKINQGNALADLDRDREALAAYQDALKISQAAGLAESEIVALIDLADQALRGQAYARAASLARQALIKAGEIDSKSSMAVARANLGFALAGQGNLKEGVQHIDTALQTYHESGSRGDEESLMAELSALYERAGLMREALETSRRQLKLSREIFRADQVKAIASLQEKFQDEQRQKQIDMLARENRMKDTELANRRLEQEVALLGVVVAFLASVLLLLLYRRVRQSNEQLTLVNNELAFQSMRDPLTGLYNRRSFLDLMVHRAEPGVGGRRENDAEIPDGLLILDVDHFKQVNDAWGHATGDAVLVQIAERLKGTIRESDRLLRWGGEEFLVYSPQTDLQRLTGLAERLLQAAGGEPLLVNGRLVPITVTGGFIALPYAGLDETVCNWERALQIADMAMYLGKAKGRNRACGVGALLVAPEQALPILERDLAAALKAGMVELIEVAGPAQTSKIDLAG